jgi:hypothetical protein
MSPTNADRNVKIKLKKDALEFVDCNKEYQHDPKYKTELCKTWTESVSAHMGINADLHMAGKNYLIR